MNAYDEGFQNSLKFRDDRAASAQAREINDANLKRQAEIDARRKVEEQQADTKFGREIVADDKALADQAKLRGLAMLKTGLDKKIPQADIINAMGPGALKAFGTDPATMMQFVNEVARNPAILDAQIASLTGSAKPKTVQSEEYVMGPDGKPGAHVIYSDGSNEFIPGYKKQFAPPTTGGAAQASGLPGVVFKDGGYFDAAGNRLSPDDVATMARDFKAAQAAGTAAGKAGEADIGFTPVQAINAKTQFDSMTLKNENLNNSIDRALDGVDWASAGIVGQLRTVGGEPANLAALLQSVGAQIGLDELTKLKQSGVTLGQVTEAEHALLQSMIANLSQIQDPQQLREALLQIKQQSNKAWRITRDNLTEIAKAKGGSVGGSAPAAAPAAKKSSKYYD